MRSIRMSHCKPIIASNHTHSYPTPPQNSHQRQQHVTNDFRRMTHLYVCHDSFTCVTWLIHMHNTFQPDHPLHNNWSCCVYHDTFIRSMAWLVNTRVAFSHHPAAQLALLRVPCVPWQMNDMTHLQAWNKFSPHPAAKLAPAPATYGKRLYKDDSFRSIQWNFSKSQPTTALTLLNDIRDDFWEFLRVDARLAQQVHVVEFLKSQPATKSNIQNDYTTDFWESHE